ncbi:hypothetical protein JCM11491_002967 [Sporobolomyces phaffii]
MRTGRDGRRLPRQEDPTDSTDPNALFDVPPALLSFYQTLGTKGSLTCAEGVVIDERSEGYKTNGQGKDGTHYCAKEKRDPAYIWWMSNMDVDYDGAPTTEGICEGDGSYFELTAFTDGDGEPINALTVPYVVINQGDGIDPAKLGVQPLSVVAVLCGGKLTFGIWADSNALGSMGEASVNLARICFGRIINGNYGHGEPDVLYLAFPGSEDETVPPKFGNDLEAMYRMGHELIDRAFQGPTSNETGSKPTAAAASDKAEMQVPSSLSLGDLILTTRSDGHENLQHQHDIASNRPLSFGWCVPQCVVLSAEQGGNGRVVGRR